MNNFDKEFNMHRIIFGFIVVIFVFIIANLAMDTFVKFKLIETGVKVAEDPKGNAKELGKIVREFKKGMEEENDN